MPTGNNLWDTNPYISMSNVRQELVSITTANITFTRVVLLLLFIGPNNDVALYARQKKNQSFYATWWTFITHAFNNDMQKLHQGYLETWYIGRGSGTLTDQYIILYDSVSCIFFLLFLYGLVCYFLLDK